MKEIFKLLVYSKHWRVLYSNHSIKSNAQNNNSNKKNIIEKMSK